MKKHLSISTTVTLTALILAALVSLPSVDARQDNRAQTLLAQARAALGGDAKLKSIQTLSTSAKFRRIIAKDQPEMSGELQLDFLLPDKYIATEVSNLPMGDAQITRINGFNGDQAFRDTRTSGGGNIVIRMGNGPDNQPNQAAQLRAVRAEFTIYVIGWLLAAPQTQTVDFSYGGEAQAEEGRADVIDIKSADDFAMRLFLDKETHRPLMLSYRGTQPGMIFRMQTASAGSHEDADKLAKEAQERTRREAEGQPPPKTVEIQMYLSDYRNVGGILLPHHITRAINGEVNEEWDVTKFKINPPLKPENFKK
ncbi:MAG TPA: hypothetical protein VGV87_06900 [Blastocatellia bacterium]|jgi:hypothetical protein|nr:hypothetical protein [Blastocatellia bacterium]